MLAALATNDELTVTTSSPGPTPTARSAKCSAAVPLATAQACGAPTAAATSRSNAATSTPWLTQPERSTRLTAASSAAPRTGRARGSLAAISGSLGIGPILWAGSGKIDDGRAAAVSRGAAGRPADATRRTSAILVAMPPSDANATGRVV